MMINLSISNIAWPSDSRRQIYELIAGKGVKGVEIALTKIAPWDDLTESAIADERQLLGSFGLAVSSYQALFFGRPDLALLGDAASFDAMVAHTVRVARAAEQLSRGGAGVFGAPRNRIRGQLSQQDAMDLGAERFRRLAEAVAPYGFVLVLEPAPSEYGGDFLQTEQECAAMVERVGHPAFRLHIDTGCLSLAGEDGPGIIAEHGALIGHVHLSQPSLNPIDETAIDCYRDLFRSLAQSGYDEWIAIEMRETEQPERTIANAIRVVNAALDRS